MLFHSASNFMEIKIALLNEKITANALKRQRNLPRLSPITPLACANSNCKNTAGWESDPRWPNRMGIGLTTFYYPHELSEPHNNANNPYGPNFVDHLRLKQCWDGPQVIRYIPYCTKCMLKFVNYGERKDKLEVPYGYLTSYALHGLAAPTINNL